MNDEYETTLAHLLDSFDASENVREVARALAHRAFAAELHERQPLTEVVVCAVYITFQHESNEYRFRDITTTTTFDSISIARTYRLLSDELDLDLAPANLHGFVSRFAGSLDMEERTEALAHDIVDESSEAGLHTGRNPAGVAGGAVYLADSDYYGRLTQDEVAVIAGVSTLTIRHRFHEQADLLDVSNLTTAKETPPGNWPKFHRERS
jgi:transcription initiation factor TFIIB